MVDTPKIILPPIPAKRYFTIGEVSELCGVKPHVLRYWEQEFTQLKPVKRRGNRRYYQHHEVLLIRKIRELLYEEGFTISGARNRLEGVDERAEKSEKLDKHPAQEKAKPEKNLAEDVRAHEAPTPLAATFTQGEVSPSNIDLLALKQQLQQIIQLLNHA